MTSRSAKTGGLRYSSAWPRRKPRGDRVLIGSPHRRPLLDPAERAASMGRVTLVADITVGDTQILVAPPARVPKTRASFCGSTAK